MKTSNFTIFSYADYRAYLEDLIETYPLSGRGIRKSWALAITCQGPFISHVLAGRNDLSLEQAEATTRYFNLNQEESKYFMTLVQFNRASTTELKKYFQKELKQITKKAMSVKKQVNIQKSLPESEKSVYYSNWQYAVIHIALTIEDCNTVSDLQKKLLLPKKTIEDALSFLEQNGILKRIGAKYIAGDSVIHLEKNSSFINSHHTNMRLLSVERLKTNLIDDFRYSGVISISRNDYNRVRKILADSLKEMVQVIKPSPPEELCLLSLDFVKL